jgi:predicted esterase
MGSLTYTKLLNRTLDLYREGNFAKAYEFISENSWQVQGNPAQILNFRYSLACKLGQTELAMQLFRKAVQEKGYWYSHDYLISDDDLLPLQQFSEFNELVQLCKEREELAKKNTRSELKMFDTSDSEGNGCILLALHGNEESIYLTEGYWAPCTSHGCRLSLIQSSQIGFSGGYYWNDVEKGAEDLQHQYEALSIPNKVEPDHVLIGGFSAGCQVALYSILNNKVPIKKFIFIAPWLPDLIDWEPSFKRLESIGIKGYIICGERDRDCLDHANALADMMKDHDIACQLQIIEELDHDYPDSFPQDIERALLFLKG